ncbi:MAG: hypothetical protein ACTHLW_12830, partial [Verrucomicrobiota bacterium]
MASLYRRKGSPYFWLKYRAQDGSVKQVSTGCSLSSQPEVRRAKQMEAQKSLEELQYGDSRKLKEGWQWVDEYLDARYQSNALSLERYQSAWASLKMFIEEKSIKSPAALLRQHCFDYVAWRKKPDKSKGKYKACLNTALVEIKVLRIVMQEAVVRGMAAGNPCYKLGIKQDKPKEKPELTEDQCALIRREILKVEDAFERTMLATSFEIARYQGCRLSETRLNPMTDVDIANRRIRFYVKGGKEHSTLLHEKLVPFFTKLQADGCVETWTVPLERTKSRQWAGNVWFRFFN